jgi:hypothetical protein
VGAMVVRSSPRTGPQQRQTQQPQTPMQQPQQKQQQTPQTQPRHRTIVAGSVDVNPGRQVAAVYLAQRRDELTWFVDLERDWQRAASLRRQRQQRPSSPRSLSLSSISLDSNSTAKNAVTESRPANLLQQQRQQTLPLVSTNTAIALANDDSQSSAATIAAHHPTDNWRSQLVAFYTRHNPSKVDSIDATLQKYSGREAELWSKLQSKYEQQNEVQPYPSPPIDETLQQLRQLAMLLCCSAAHCTLPCGRSPHHAPLKILCDCARATMQ